MRLSWQLGMTTTPFITLMPGLLAFINLLRSAMCQIHRPRQYQAMLLERQEREGHFLAFNYNSTLGQHVKPCLLPPRLFLRSAMAWLKEREHAPAPSLFW